MNVKVRKFPYPYKCAFSISSDIDNATSLEYFVHFMDFLNTDIQTIYGPGLDLEVGNSFWFFILWRLIDCSETKALEVHRNIYDWVVHLFRI